MAADSGERAGHRVPGRGTANLMIDWETIYRVRMQTAVGDRPETSSLQRQYDFPSANGIVLRCYFPAYASVPPNLERLGDLLIVRV
jgi:hypothetical protein